MDSGPPRYHHQTGLEVTRLADAEWVRTLWISTIKVVTPITDMCKYDTLNWYRDWAIKEGFAIIDVNFPNHIADADVCFLSFHTHAHTLRCASYIN